MDTTDHDIAGSPNYEDMEEYYEDTPSTSISGGRSHHVPELPQPIKKKRRREALSCSECKRRKIGCDRKKPCGPCARRGESDMCKWSVLPPVDKPIGRSSYNALKDQLTSTQKVCKELQALCHKQADEMQALRSQIAAPSSPASSPAAHLQHKRPVGPLEQFQAQAESFKSARKDRARVASSYTHSSTSPPSTGNGGAPPVLIQASETLDGFPAFPDVDAGLGRSNQPEINSASDVWTGIPERWVCDQLTDFFFSDIEWHICMFHRPTFDSNYRKFWSLNTAAERAEVVNPQWMALWWSILCLALTSMGPEEPIKRGICVDRQTWKGMGKRFWLIAEQALRDADYMSSQNIETVQALVLSSYCNLSLDNQGYKSQAAMTALAIRIGMNQGLHRLGQEPHGVAPPKGLIQRELRRRVWWNVVFLDWNISTQMNSTYLIHPNQCNTAKPMNLDWDDMVEGRPLPTKPTVERTSASMLLAKVGLAGTVRELTDRINSMNGVLDSAYLPIHKAQQDALLRTLPMCWRVPDSALEDRMPVVRWEYLQFNLHMHNRRIRMHRPFMLDGYRDGTYHAHPSTGPCVRAAHAILVLFKDGQEKGFPGFYAWYNLMYCWMAAVILAMDAFYLPNEKVIGTEIQERSRNDYIMFAIETLERSNDISEIASRGAHVLRFLLAEAQKRTSAGAQNSPASSQSSHLSAGMGPATVQYQPQSNLRTVQDLQFPSTNVNGDYANISAEQAWMNFGDLQPDLLNELSMTMPSSNQITRYGNSTQHTLQWAQHMMRPHQPQQMMP
ncbi:hypothetical protein DACRYDRAFT_21034 [Dacryopinax primogenitus]|uniref:Zn(2)-C6 fungal-type domain-containing protein n=1 Tax=Dacryopinax primogenitus (strain DJM 731) TaxID=1858805 RepID=M5FZG7_DACPD|nr:uncharacterized protein DACRYDRAFT_21034 [Dacryopinax primogenitus]EJU03431.1 hypothetical protein DACRYDRAFT_21034 [Dacryopinax primogenitus]